MKLLMLDIETAPHKVYAWGLFDQNIAINQIEEPGYTLCWAAKWYGEKKIHFSSINDGEKQMLKTIHGMINEADAVIHYNGTKFDMPTLNKEFLRFGLTPPSPYKQIDLLQTARRQFRLASNKLDYVAQSLGLGCKVQHKGMELWRDCMRGDKKSWNIMCKYNKQDVALLELVYEKFLPWIVNHPNMGLFSNSESHVCTNCGSSNLQKRGHARTATQIYQRYQCNDCASWVRGRTSLLDKNVRKNITVRDR